MDIKTGVYFITLFVGSFAFPAVESDFSQLFYHTDSNARIVGGTQAAVGAHPHMVALSNGVLIRGFICGGSLLNHRQVLTAAHCIDAVFLLGSLSSSLRATVGTNRWNLGGQSYAIVSNVTHQHYVSGTIKNDIGILTTGLDVVMSNLVQPVALGLDFVGAGIEVKAAGWGRTRNGGSVSANLLELTVFTIDGQQCVEDVAKASVEFNIRAPDVEPHIELCTVHSPGHGMCNGDSGSALMHVDRQQQVGVVSWGFPCARGAPDMFTRLSAYREWILLHGRL